MDYLKKIQDIKTLKVQGAENIAKAGLTILRDFARQNRSDDKKFMRGFLALANKVSRARPTEPALRQEIFFVTEKVKISKTPKKDTIKLCNFYIKNILLVKKKIALYGSRKIKNKDIIMTHCHSNTVMAIFREAKKQGKKFSVIVTETRPKMQGEKTANDLRRMRVPFIYVLDSAMALFMKQATKVFVGSDALLSNGSIVNKIGTEATAIVAKEFRVPVFVAAGTHKFDEKTIFGFEEPLEERNPKEIWNNKKIKILNPAFDITSANYISEIITERGVFSPNALAAILSKEAIGNVH
ncbi:MAG: S-methyl-5-thioribose-1-phosphate isomerase [Candidatus Aenigmarchaeota archaeon]|nr:S-methyl-5-thioribose-1-phosphate isomerase [Candidatus Aenigmarchaeota archaeon]